MPGLAVGGDRERRFRLIVVDPLDAADFDAGLVEQNLLRLLPDASADERDGHFRAALPALRLQMIKPRPGAAAIVAATPQE